MNNIKSIKKQYKKMNNINNNEQNLYTFEITINLCK